MPAQKRPLPPPASPGPDAHVEEAPGADADGAGGRRSPKLTLNGAPEERGGGPRQATDRRHGTAACWALDRARRPADAGRLPRDARTHRAALFAAGVAERVLVWWALADSDADDEEEEGDGEEGGGGGGDDDCDSQSSQSDAEMDE
jgi:E3 ubiquitin-protein ligase RNF1/2